MSDSEIQINQRAFARVRRTGAYRAVVHCWMPGTILACSGGTDSAALATIAHVAMKSGRIPPFLMAHVDHRTRPESADEGRFVARLARTIGVPFVQTTIDGENDPSERGLEAELRELRYAALARLAQRLEMRRVATAHTRDDQIETILLRLFAGAGGRALSGIREFQQIDSDGIALRLSRPLLDISRSELEEILHITGVPHVEDPSNRDTRFRRNLMRHDVIPQLMRLDQGFGSGLIRTVSLASEDATALDRIADDLFYEHVVEDRQRTVIPRELILSLDVALASRIVRMSAKRLASGDARELSRERVLAVVQAASGRSGIVIELPYGIAAYVSSESLIVTSERIHESERHEG